MPRIAAAVLLAFFILPGAAHAALVDINTASAAQLDTLPGIGPSKAAAIIAYRQEHGPFYASADIQKVKGIGPATYATLASLITVGSVERPVSTPAATRAVPVAPAPRAAVTEPQPAAPVAAAVVASPVTSVSPAGMVSSSWTLLFLGVVVIAGGALLII